MTRKLRIAIILDDIDTNEGGSFVSGKRFAAGLAKAGHHIIYITSKFTNEAKKKEFAYETIYECPSLPPIGAYGVRFAYTSAARVTNIFRQEKIDIVYSIQPTIIARQAVRAARRLHIPIVSHSHTMPDSFLPGFPQCIQKLVKKFVAMLYRKYDGLIYPTDFLRKKFTDCHFNVPEAVIGNGVDTAIFYPNEKKLSDYFSLLYVGRLDARKNISLLLEALKILHDQKKLHANFHCTIVGGGNMEKKLKKITTEYKLGNVVEFAGVLPTASPSLVKKFQEASAFVLPSLYETEGMVVLEAMACGLSILIANSPTSASPGFVKNNGYVFAPHDAKDLAQKIEKLISDPELLADMRKASLDNVKDFAFTTSVEKLESFLLSFIQK